MCNIQLTQEQTTSVQSYVRSNTNAFKNISLPTEGFTFQLNALLRANVSLGSVLHQYIRRLDSAFDNASIKEDIKVYRACNYLEMYRYIKDNKYFDYGYMSTSKNIKTTQGFYQSPQLGYLPAFLTINIPKDSKVLDLETIVGFDNTTYESEILIKRKSLFEIKTNNVISTEILIDKIGIQTKEEFQEIRVLVMKFLSYIE